MPIEIIDNKTGAIVEAMNGVFTIDENTEYKVYDSSGTLRKNDFRSIGTYLTPELAILKVTNKVGSIELSGHNIRIRSKLGDSFFHELKTEISNIESRLLLSNTGSTDSFSLSHRQYSEEVAFALLKKSWKNGELQKSLRYIIDNPNSGLTKTKVSKNITKGERLTTEDYKRLAQATGPFIKFKGVTVPAKFTSYNQTITNDILEVRFTKFFLNFCSNILRRNLTSLRDEQSMLKDKTNTHNNSNSSHALNSINQLNLQIRLCQSKEKECLNIWKKINGFIQSPLIKDIKTTSQIDLTSLKLHKNYHYKYLLSLYLDMRRSFKTSSSDDWVFLDIRSIDSLYEYYCFIKIINDFSVPPESVKSIILKCESGWIINTESPIPLGNSNNCSLSLFFKKSFSKGEETFSQNYSPDYTIEFQNNSGSRAYFHLDAKYRLRNGKAVKDDIDKMHTYTHAIKNSKGSVVLFPGDTNTDYNCIDSKVGALFCTPLNSQNLKCSLQDIFFNKLRFNL